MDRRPSGRSESSPSTRTGAPATPNGPTSLHWILHHPTPYKNLLFRTLAATDAIDLKVHFVEPGLATHPWSSVAPEGFVSRCFSRTLGVDLELLGLAARDASSLLVVAGWNEPTMQLVASLRALRRRPFALWTDTPELARPRSLPKAVARSRWLRWLFGRALAVMGTGRPALSALRQMGCPEAKLVDLPCFVDLAEFSPPPPRPPASTIAFAASGRLIGEKGYDLALRALARVFAGRAGDFCFRIAGTGPELEPLRRLAEELGIASRVEFLGWLEPKDLPRFYAAADVFLHPARWEPYGVAVLEAMATGNVVIGSDATGAVLDRIEPGVNGFVHRAEDVADLAGRIEAVLARWPEVEPLRRAARSVAEQWPVSRGARTVKSILDRLGRPE